MKPEELLRFSRHLVLPSVGATGQDRLRQTRALVIGAGGIGIPAATYLATSGIGQLTIVDDDCVDITNLPRQVVFTPSDIGRPKAKVLADHLMPRATGVIQSRHQRAQLGTISLLIDGHDVVIDCTDTFPSRDLVAKACFARRRPLIRAAVIQTTGQLLCLSHQSPQLCARCVFPSVSQDGSDLCADLGVLAPLAGMVGMMATAVVIQALSYPEINWPDRLVAMELAPWRMRDLSIQRDEHCEWCSLKEAGDARIH